MQEEELKKPEFFLLDNRESQVVIENSIDNLVSPMFQQPQENITLWNITPENFINNFVDGKKKIDRPKAKKKTLPKTNSFSGPTLNTISNQNQQKITPKSQNIFAKNRRDATRGKEDTELTKILRENARQKYIHDLWANNFLIIAMFIKKFIETLKSINIVSKFLKLTKYHYNIIDDKVCFYEGFDECIDQQWMVPSKHTTKRFVKSKISKKILV
jgi:hypothetical protein